MIETQFNSIEERIIASPLSKSDKDELISISKGEILPSLCSDVVAKKVFSPDEHSDRLDFILQRIMKDEKIMVNHSAANEGMLQNLYSKKVISDIPAWLKDHRLTDLEIQVAAQEYIFKRTDIYASNMLMIQYSAEMGQAKGEIDYSNVNSVIIVVLMKNSPKMFREYDTKRYIHRITSVEADSGMKFPLLRQMAFVQLDKALDEFMNETYCEDEDLELLKMLVTIADINNDKIKMATDNDKMYNEMREEISIFSKSKEVQTMLLAEKMAIADWNSNRSAGQEEISELYAWLDEQGRDEDRRKAYKDAEFRKKLLDEFNAR